MIKKEELDITNSVRYEKTDTAEGAVSWSNVNKTQLINL